MKNIDYKAKLDKSLEKIGDRIYLKVNTACKRLGSSFDLDEAEIKDIKNSPELQRIWEKHVEIHLKMKDLKIGLYQEEYNFNATLDFLLFDHKFKFSEHILTTFKKFFLGERYTDQKPNEMFVEIWFEVNQAVTLGQIFDGSAELIRLAKKARDSGDNANFKRLHGISENAECFRRFCSDGFKNCNFSE